MGLSVDDFGEKVTFGDAIDIVEGLKVEWGTHTHASVLGWMFPATVADVTSSLLMAKVLNFLADKDAVPVAPIVPWRDPNYVSPEERAKYQAMLEARSAFAGRGDDD